MINLLGIGQIKILKMRFCSLKWFVRSLTNKKYSTRIQWKIGDNKFKILKKEEFQLLEQTFIVSIVTEILIWSEPRSKQTYTGTTENFCRRHSLRVKIYVILKWKTKSSSTASIACFIEGQAFSPSNDLAPTLPSSVSPFPETLKISRHFPIISLSLHVSMHFVCTYHKITNNSHVGWARFA